MRFNLIISVYRVPQMQGVECTDDLLYFKCLITKQMRCPMNPYGDLIGVTLAICWSIYLPLTVAKHPAVTGIWGVDAADV